MEADDDYEVFVPRDPPGEDRETIEKMKKQGNENYGVRVQAEQNNRLMSIVKVGGGY